MEGEGSNTLRDDLQAHRALPLHPFSLAELVNEITAENLHDCVDWGKAVGDEIW